MTGAGKSTLVIGGAGYIGAYLVSQLLDTGRRVTVVGRSAVPRYELPKGAEYVRGDFADGALMAGLLDTHGEVIHLAYASVPNTSFDNPLSDLVQNAEPAVQLFALAAARKVKVVFVSSGGTVYGDGVDSPLRETHPTKPISSYGVTKLALENFARLYSVTHGLQYVCVRPANPYGIGQRPFAGQGFVATAIASAMRSKPITVFGQHGTTRDYIYVSDLAAGIVSALESGHLSETYNIGSAIGLSNLEMIQAFTPIVNQLGFEVRTEHTAERPFDVKSNVLDSRKLQEHTGWRPRIDLADGLQRTCAWLLAAEQTAPPPAADAPAKPAPTISVAMPVYNAGPHLAAALESILAQSFTDFELIALDDGSTDSSLEVLRAFEKKDARVRVITRENRNLATTLNEIVDVARGEWIARMDQDDIAYPHRFSRQLEWLASTGADICGSWVRQFGPAGNRVLRHPEAAAAIKMELLFGSPFAHPTVMMRTALVRALRYDKAWESCEDYDLWERAARAGWKMTNVPEVLLDYRQHATQVSSNASTRQHALTQQIRRRCWEPQLTSMQLDPALAGEILNLREPAPRRPDMDKVDLVFGKLMDGLEGETRAVAFDHATRLYFRASGSSPDIAARWSELRRRAGGRGHGATMFKLWLLSHARIDADSDAFRNLKKMYFYLKR